jgi:hypothetical protein
MSPKAALDHSDYSIKHYSTLAKNNAQEPRLKETAKNRDMENSILHSFLAPHGIAPDYFSFCYLFCEKEIRRLTILKNSITT